MTRIHLVRHGETDWNRELRWQGQADRPLNERGRQQARELADALARNSFAAVYSSDLQRAAETAAIVAARLGLPVRFQPALRELDLGSWEGHTFSEIEARFPEALAGWQKDGEPGWENGETHEQMAARVVEAVHALAQRHAADDVLVVTHGGPIRSLKALVAGLEFPRERRLVPRTENCGVFAIEVVDGAIRGID